MAGLLSLLILVGCIQQTQLAHQDNLDVLQTAVERGRLRVATRYDVEALLTDEHSEAGLEHELLSAFATDLGIEIEYVTVASTSDLYAALEHGLADMAATAIDESHYQRSGFRHSTPHMALEQHVLYRHGTQRPNDTEDLLQRRVMVKANTRAAELLAAEQQRLGSLRWMESTESDTFDILSKIAAGEINYAVIKSTDFFLHQGLFPLVEVAFNLGPSEQSVWLMREGRLDDSLYARTQQFMGAFAATGELELLHERLVGYVPDFNRRTVRTFARRAKKELQGLESTLRKVGEQENIDWLLLAAISYQESHWDPDSVSRTGVKGMMMLTHAAASEVGVSDRTDMLQSLRGGARYFNRLLSRLPDEIIEPDRTLFALAAYNAGYGHIQDARKIAEMRGFDPNRWSDVEQQLPLLTRKEWYSKTLYGYSRGYETVGYVRNIRQYHRFLQYRTGNDNSIQLAMNTH
jgi:membrane-bound lytic murein transglycosylase F